MKDFVPILVDIDDPAEADIKATYAAGGAVPQIVWCASDGTAYERSVYADEVDDILFAIEESLLGIEEDSAEGDAE